ncbi:HEAT repeat domain-containing protein [Nocardia colli]|uniref:HEAT repeat domain-containing protein n=1 Tax=Nocardia colli TaxID=2545717 RepID=A0A5N0E4E5_9NOCA|nr:HEAT repeat domain-containing protein [Nocardia colli]KAA8884302.1 HEAT repeat domain-containing protein [Nocardia colli]
MDGDEPQEVSLTSALASGESGLQFNALIEAIKVGDGARIPEILPLLRTGDEGVRGEAVRAIGFLGVGQASTVGPLIESMLADPEEMVRSEAAEAFCTVHYEPAADRLAGMLRTDESWLVRASVAEALGNYPGHGVQELLDCVRDDDEYVPVRRYAIDSLVRSDESLARARTPALVEDFGDDPDFGRDVRMTAYRFGDRDQIQIVADEVGALDETECSLLLNNLGKLVDPPIPASLQADLPLIDDILSVIALRWPLQRPHVTNVRTRLQLTDSSE